MNEKIRKKIRKMMSKKIKEEARIESLVFLKELLFSFLPLSQMEIEIRRDGRSLLLKKRMSLLEVERYLLNLRPVVIIKQRRNMDVDTDDKELIIEIEEKGSFSVYEESKEEVVFVLN